jgi:hypothetical protein
MVQGRVALFQSGLAGAKQYLTVRDAINRCDFGQAKNQ